jgi:DNA-binding winged helix-turn-helix (wHTH) protein
MSSENGVAVETGGTDQPIICFADFRLDLRLRCLYRGAEKVKLTPKPFSTLEFLIKNRTRVVSKAELLDKVWGGDRDVSTVEHAISQLRRSLGDAADETGCIQTVTGQGYRFVAELRPLAASEAVCQEPAIATSDEASGPAQASAATGTGPSKAYARKFRPALISVFVLVCLGVLGAAIAHIVARDHVVRGLWNGNTFCAMDDSGRMLWKYAFQAPLWGPPAEESAWRTQIVDLDGEGVPEILVAAMFGPPESGGQEEIFCFSSNGILRWRYKPKIAIKFNTRDLNGPWRFTDMVVVPERRSGSIWVAVVHDLWWPSFIDRISGAGVRIRMFTSSGDIMALRRVQTKAGPYILAAGVNNEYRQASLAILSETGPPTTSPQAVGSEYQCIQGCPAAKPYRYILLPRSELSITSDEPYNVAARIHARTGGVTVETYEGSGVATGFYDFSQDLQPERVAYGGNYREIHRRFEKEGRIKHSFRDCPERKSSAILRICDDHGNWSTVRVPRVPSLD